MSFTHIYISQLPNGLQDALLGMSDYRAIFRAGVNYNQLIFDEWMFNSAHSKPSGLFPQWALMQTTDCFDGPVEQLLPTLPDTKCVLGAAYARRHPAKKRSKVEASFADILG